MDDVARYALPFVCFLFFYVLLRRRGELPAGRPAWRDTRSLTLLGAIVVVFVLAVVLDDS